MSRKERAQFVSKWTDYKYNRRDTYLTYKYRGYEYTICDRHNGSRELASEHDFEQNRIDFIIEQKQSPRAEHNDAFTDFCEIYEAWEELIDD